MKVRVQYTGQLRTAIGRPEDDVELPDGSHLEQLLACVAERCDPSVRAHLVTDTGNARPSLLLAVNGLAVGASGASRTVLQSGDVVTLLPPIAGG